MKIPGTEEPFNTSKRQSRYSESTIEIEPLKEITQSHITAVDVRNLSNDAFLGSHENNNLVR